MQEIRNDNDDDSFTAGTDEKQGAKWIQAISLTINALELRCSSLKLIFSLARKTMSACRTLEKIPSTNLKNHD